MGKIKQEIEKQDQEIKYYKIDMSDSGRAMNFLTTEKNSYFHYHQTRLTNTGVNNSSTLCIDWNGTSRTFSYAEMMR